MKQFKSIIFLLLSVSFIISNAQNTTINNKKDNDPREPVAAHKVMLIPFEQRLYLSEIDHHINAETKLTAREIKYKFRDGINEQLFKAFKASKYNALDLMDDTAKYKKDLESIYQFLNYDFQLIPDQNNYQPPKKEKEEKKIDKGQLNIETDLEARFMNAKLANPKLLPGFYSKYKSDVFVFINELEIKSSGSNNPAELSIGNNSTRKIIVHYTVYTKEYKEINSGTAETEFETTLNNPKKIIDKYFAKIASMIVERTNKALSLQKK